VSKFPYFITDPRKHYKKYNGADFIPCWSVGRLIEIALICAETDTRPYISFIGRTNNIDYMMSIFENYANYLMDFSRLEE
jgi:hypothetical protein